MKPTVASPSSAVPTPSVASHLQLRPQWLRLLEEAVLEPELPIVDAHHHLWDHASGRYFLPDMLEDLSSGHNIRATVAVECHAMYREDATPALRPVGETEFLNGAAAMSASGAYGRCRVAAGIVAHADLCLGAAVRPVLEAHARAAGGRLRGVRYSAVWHPDPAARGSLARPPAYVLGDPKFRAGFAELGPLDLSFDAWVYHTQIAEVVDLARCFPETRIVLNHIGGVIGIGPYAERREEVRAEWLASLGPLADCANVSVKLGGMGMRLFGFDFAQRALPPSSVELADSWRSYIAPCLQLFGAQRCMFESNFPVDKGSFSYGVLWNAFKRLADDCGLTAAQKEAAFSGTARQVYRLPELNAGLSETA